MPGRSGRGRGCRKGRHHTTVIRAPNVRGKSPCDQPSSRDESREQALGRRGLGYEGC